MQRVKFWKSCSSKKGKIKSPSIRFAVLVYELSYYLRKEVRRMADFRPEILSRYPILFVRKGDELSATPYDEGNDLVCYYREQAQDLLTYEI